MADFLSISLLAILLTNITTLSISAIGWNIIQFWRNLTLIVRDLPISFDQPSNLHHTRKRKVSYLSANGFALRMPILTSQVPLTLPSSTTRNPGIEFRSTSGIASAIFLIFSQMKYQTSPFRSIRSIIVNPIRHTIVNNIMTAFALFWLPLQAHRLSDCKRHSSQPHIFWMQKAFQSIVRMQKAFRTPPSYFLFFFLPSHTLVKSGFIIFH